MPPVQKTRALRVCVGIMLGGMGLFGVTMARRSVPFGAVGGVLLLAALGLIFWPGRRS